MMQYFHKQKCHKILHVSLHLGWNQVKLCALSLSLCVCVFSYYEEADDVMIVCQKCSLFLSFFFIWIEWCFMRNLIY